MQPSIQQQYACAVFPDRYRVAWRTLKPMTLGHVLLLERLGNPWADPPPLASPDYARTLQAAYVCSQSWQRAASAVSRPACWLWIHAMLRLRRGRASVADTATWVLYHAASWRLPEWEFTREPAAGRGAGWLQVLKLYRLTDCGQSESEALSTPLAVAWWDYLAYWESEGAVRIGTPDDDALLALAKAEAIKDAAAARLPRPGCRPINGG